MKIKYSFKSKRILFDNLLLSDITDDYLSWINKREIVKFTAIKKKIQSKICMIMYQKI